MIMNRVHVLVWFGLVFATKGFPKYNDHMNGALSSRAATGQLRHVKHDVKVPIDHFESQMGHVSQSQVVTGMFFAMEPDIVERRFGSAGGVLGSPSARKPAPVLFSESNQTVKQARQAPGRGHAAERQAKRAAQCVTTSAPP
jgi:hypothetical protein